MSHAPDGSSWGDFGSTTLISPNRWCHIAFTCDGSIRKIYINGMLNATSTPGNTYTGTNTQMCIGTRPVNDENGNHWAFFNGKIDEVRVWNYAPHPGSNRCKHEYPHCGANTVSGLIAYYQFDQGTADGNNSGLTTLADSSASGLNGTLANFDLSGTSPIGPGVQ